jgi:hypothetical protein
MHSTEIGAAARLRRCGSAIRWLLFNALLQLGLKQNQQERSERMIAITTVYVSLVEPEDDSTTGAAPEKVRMEDLRRTIENKLLEEPDANRTLVTVYAGTNEISGDNS